MMLQNNNKEKSINNPLLSELFKVGLSVEMLISQCLRYVLKHCMMSNISISLTSIFYNFGTKHRFRQEEMHNAICSQTARQVCKEQRINDRQRHRNHL